MEAALGCSQLPSARHSCCIPASAFTAPRAPLENLQVNQEHGGEEMKFIGLLMAIVGWLIPVVTLVLTQSNTARLIVCLVGLAISLIGILVVMNRSHLKEAIWKA